ncbi:MAG: M28 family peptidase [Solimonas sp.]
MKMRTLMTTGGAMTLMAATMLAAGAAQAATKAAKAAPWPSAQLDASAAQTVDPAQIVSLQQLRDWQVDLDQRGLRATGSPSHEAYVTELHKRLLAAGLKDVRYETLSMQRWTPGAWSLTVLGGPSAGKLPTAGYVPYSGITPAAGLSAPLVGMPKDRSQDAGMAGKIVVFDLPKVPLTVGFFKKLALFSYDPENSLPAETPYVRPHNEIAVADAALRRIEAAGAAGGIAIVDDVAETAHGAYYPYGGDLRKVPSLFVDRDTGARLKAIADGNTSVRLALPAKVETVPTRNIVAIIPGMSDELVVINSHTDGTNGVEDNGPNIAVAIAQYLNRLPREALPRSVMVLLTSGHFAGGNGAIDFFKRHENDGLLKRIAATVTIEHLGSQEYLAGADGKLAPTGQAELAAMFMPRVPALVEASSKFLRDADATRSFVMPPLNPENKGTHHGAVWPGEGQYFWSQGDLPNINYISGPTYLLHWGVTTADKVDYERMRRETVGFTQMMLDLSRLPMSELRPQP